MISVSYKKLSLSVCLSSDIFVVEIWTPKHEKGARSRTEGWENMQHKTLALSIVRILLHPAPPLASFGIPVTFVVILTIMFFFFNDSLSSVNNSCSSATLESCVLLSNRTCCATIWLQASAREQTINFMRKGRDNHRVLYGVS